MKVNIYMMFFVVCVTVFSCSCSTVVDRFTMEHMIAVDSEGRPRLYPVKVENGCIKADEYTFGVQLEYMVRAIQKSGRKKILIFVFGGMNSLAYNVERSGELAKIIMEKSDYYPVFVSWESNLFYAYYDHLFFIRRGVKSYTFGPALAPFYLMVDIGRAVTRLPINLVYQTYGTFYADYSDPVQNVAVNEQLRSNCIRAYVGRDKSSDSMRYLRRITYTLGFPLRVISTPLIDVAGKSAWDVMKRRSRLAFIRTRTFEELKDSRVEINFQEPDGAMSLFMNRMVELYASDNSYEFTLMGHSMGPIIINELVSRYDMIPYKNIVYLAPACCVGDTVKVMRPYLERHPESTFYNLCIHPNMEMQEMMIYGFLPRGSILEWIDLYLADPLSRDDLTLGQWNNAIELMPGSMISVREQVVIKSFGMMDPVTNNIKLNMPAIHTDFSDPAMRFWEPEFWNIPESSDFTRNPLEE